MIVARPVLIFVYMLNSVYKLILLIICLVIQKVAFEKMIDLDAKTVVSAMKIIDLDTEVSIEKAMVALVFEIDSEDIYIAKVLMNQDIMVLFQIVVLAFKIQCLGIVIFFLVFYLVDIVTKEQYP